METYITNVPVTTNQPGSTRDLRSQPPWGSESPAAAPVPLAASREGRTPTAPPGKQWKCGRHLGRIQKMDGKTMENHGKPWKTMKNPWKTMDNPWETHGKP